MPHLLLILYSPLPVQFPVSFIMPSVLHFGSIMGISPFHYQAKLNYASNLKVLPCLQRSYNQQD